MKQRVFCQPAAFIRALALIIAFPFASVAQERAAIRLGELEGRTWLITPEGKPFFAHGITHVSNRSLRANYRAVSMACKDLGFNAYGYGCPTELKSDMPYLEGKNYVPISTYLGGSFRFIDIFDPREQRKLTEHVRQSCLQNRDNPNLIGYCWTDLAAWPLKNSVGKNWVDFIRDLPAEAPGRRAYAEFTKTWKGDDAKARDLGFLRIIAREYFRVMGEANRKHDPDHLIFGDRFAFNTIVPGVLEELLPWVDAIAIQPPFHPGFPKAKYEQIHELTGKPILICDFAIRFKDGDKPIRGWKLQDNPRVAGDRYAEYIRAALETPYIIGAFWCNPVDSTPAFNKEGIKQGLFGEGLTPRPGLGETVTELNRHIDRVTPGRDTHGSHDAPFDSWMSPLLQELNLTEEQKPKFVAIQKAMTTKWRELQKMPPKERKPRQEAFYQARLAELEQLLTPEQMAKYHEIRAKRRKPQSPAPEVAKNPDAPSGRRLRDIVAEKFPNGNVHIGATSMSPTGPVGKILAREFGYITPANDFKQTYIHPEPGQWNWDKPDAWVKFAEKHKQVIRIHGPISPQCSKWAMADDRTPEELERNLKEFMTALCKRYNGHKNVVWMDVVNETVNGNGSWKKAAPGAGWEMPWENIGYVETPAKFKHLDGKIPKYIIQAFRIATEHAPDTKLVINQHLGMEEPAWNKVKDMVLYLRSIGCRVDGVGWQAHIKLAKNGPKRWETGPVDCQVLSDLITWMHANDLEFHITENNIHVDPAAEGNADAHAKIFADIFKTLLEKRGSGVVTWNLWDIKDTDHRLSRTPKVKIGLWDRKLRAKKAYYELQTLLENPPPVK